MHKQYSWKDSSEPYSQSYIWPVIQNLLPNGKLSIVDIGCGNGNLSGKLAGLGHELVALDASEDGINIGRKCFPMVQFFQKSVYDDFKEIGTDFDVVISTEVIEHLYDPAELFKKAFDVLKPGGCLIVSTPYHGYLKNLALSIFDKWDSHHGSLNVGGHIKFFSKKTFYKIFEDSGFINISFAYAGRVDFLAKSVIGKAFKGI